MKFNFNDRNKAEYETIVLSGITLIVIYYAISNLPIIYTWFNGLLRVIMPFILGFFIALIMLPVARKIENNTLIKSLPWKKKNIRRLSVFSSLIIFILILVGVLSIIIPQLYSSVLALSDIISDNMDAITNLLNGFTNNKGNDFLITITNSLTQWLQNFVQNLSTILPEVINYSIGVIKGTLNLFIGIFIAVYILLDRERFKGQVKKIMYAIFPKNFVKESIKVWHLSSRMFNSFIIGKTVDSLIIGIICFIGMNFFSMPYPVLISVIIAITNMIPVFGPFIGAIPGILILAIVEPISALWFAIWILVLQQFDGNILGPYILGDSLGLPGLWVMFAIITGGGFFGFIGMFLGVPIFAVIYVIIRQLVYQKLDHKKIDHQLENLN